MTRASTEPQWKVVDDGKFVTAESSLYKVKFAYGGKGLGWFTGNPETGCEMTDTGTSGAGCDGSIVELYYKPTDPTASRNLVFRNGAFGGGYDALDHWEAESTGGTQASSDAPDWKSQHHGIPLTLPNGKKVEFYEKNGDLAVVFKIRFKAWEIDKNYVLNPKGRITISSNLKVVSPGTYNYLAHRFNFAGSRYSFNQIQNTFNWGGNYEADADRLVLWTDGINLFTGQATQPWSKSMVIKKDLDQNTYAHGDKGNQSYAGFLIDSVNNNDPDILVYSDVLENKKTTFEQVSNRVAQDSRSQFHEYHSYVESAIYSHSWAPHNETQVGMTWFYMTSRYWNQPGYWSTALPAWNETFHIFLTPSSDHSYTDNFLQWRELTNAPEPTIAPTIEPTTQPIASPIVAPTVSPSPSPTPLPTSAPTTIPTSGQVQAPSYRDLNVGESSTFVTSGGVNHSVVLKSQSLSQVIISVDGKSEIFALTNGSVDTQTPRLVSGVLILPEAVKSLSQIDATRFSRLNLSKDARILMADPAYSITSGTTPYNRSLQPRFDKAFLGKASYGLHLGVDLAMDEGTPVYAVRDGRVSFINLDANAGLEGIQIDLQDDGYFYRYMHLSRVVSGLRVTQAVKRGDLIGYSGKTGTSYPHLHFSMKSKSVNGRTVDINPWPYISVWKSGSTLPTQTSTPQPTQAPDTTAPSVNITNPTEGMVPATGTTLNLTATATDNKAVTKVDFSVNGSTICSDTTSSYSCSWTLPGKNGENYTIAARAFDAANNSRTDTVSISAPTPRPTPTPDTTLPTVVITSPANGATPQRWTDITISADASDNKAVAKVEFLVDGALTCSDTTAPYSCNWWIPGAVGEGFTITAKAYDSSGNTKTHAVNITTVENPDDSSPTVTLLSPTDGQTHRRWTHLNMTAVANDDRGVSKVEFLVNGQVKCTDTSEDYTCSWWMGGSVGDVYTITAKAYDEHGNTTSDSAKVTAIQYTPF